MGARIEPGWLSCCAVRSCARRASRRTPSDAGGRGVAAARASAQPVPPRRLADARGASAEQRRDASTQTADGYLWLGTRQGLARFDGVQFVHFDRTALPDLGHILMSRLLVTADSSLWIGTVGGGLSRLREGRVQTFTTRDGLPGDAILALLRGPGTAPVGGDEWRAGAVRRSGASSARGRHAAGRAGRLAAPGLDGALGRHRAPWSPSSSTPEAMTAYTEKDGLPSPHVTALAEDRDGGLWLGTPQGLSRVRDG